MDDVSVRPRLIQPARSCPEAEIIGIAFGNHSIETMDDLLAVIGERSRSSCVKQEPIDDAWLSVGKSFETVANVDEIFQTHDAVSGQFGDGRSFADLINKLDAGTIQPLTAPFLKLDVVQWPGRELFSINNRRFSKI